MYHSNLGVDGLTVLAAEDDILEIVLQRTDLGSVLLCESCIRSFRWNGLRGALVEREGPGHVSLFFFG